MPHLSIIILSYNTKKVTQHCLDSFYHALFQPKQEKDENIYEIIIIDNNSTDGSKQMLSEWQRDHSSARCIVKVILNDQNLGYPAGNNQGLRIARGEYILFANSDVICDNVDFEKLLTYVGDNPTIGALTVKVLLKNGLIDPASHRGFPTAWNAFTYFLKLEKLFGKVPGLARIFGRYHLTYMDTSTVHEIDSPAGAFYLSRKKILDKLNGFDEQFFMYGEDLDLSLRIKRAGYHILYYPYYSVTHLKYTSGLKTDNNQIKNQTKKYFYDAMKIFYRKHYEKRSPFFINWFIYLSISLKRNFL